MQFRRSKKIKWRIRLNWFLLLLSLSKFSSFFLFFIWFSGILKSYSTSNVNIKIGSNPSTSTTVQQYSVTVDQTIRYDECRHEPFNKSNQISLIIERSYVYYDSNGKLVRYASANLMDVRSCSYSFFSKLNYN